MTQPGSHKVSSWHLRKSVPCSPGHTEDFSFTSMLCESAEILGGVGCLLQVVIATEEKDTDHRILTNKTQLDST